MTLSYLFTESDTLQFRKQICSQSKCENVIAVPNDLHSVNICITRIISLQIQNRTNSLRIGMEELNNEFR